MLTIPPLRYGTGKTVFIYITKITTGRVKKDAVRGARDEFGQLEMLKG